MIGLLQTILDRGREASEQGIEPGDCMRAAVASIHELPVDQVPHFVDTGPEHDSNGQLWWWSFLGWSYAQGVHVVNYQIVEAGARVVMPGYSLVSGVSPREKNPDAERPLRHCCVAWNGELVWDPHPSGDGLTTIEDFDHFVPFTAAAADLLAKAPRDCDVARDAASITEEGGPT